MLWCLCKFHNSHFIWTSQWSLDRCLGGSRILNRLFCFCLRLAWRFGVAVSCTDHWVWLPMFHSDWCSSPTWCWGHLRACDSFFCLLPSSPWHLPLRHCQPSWSSWTANTNVSSQGLAWCCLSSFYATSNWSTQSIRHFHLRKCSWPSSPLGHYGGPLPCCSFARFSSLRASCWSLLLRPGWR